MKQPSWTNRTYCLLNNCSYYNAGAPHRCEIGKCKIWQEELEKYEANKREVNKNNKERLEY